MVSNQINALWPQSHKSNFKFQNSPNIFEMLITL